MITSSSPVYSKWQWLNGSPLPGKKVAFLIPQYNEATHCDLERRLQHFRQLAEAYSDTIDVIIIDDGSTDDSLQQIKDFLKQYPSAFYLASVYPNTQKVGALHLASLSVEHDFVVLSDFDTDLDGLAALPDCLYSLYRQTHLMGCYFKLIPFEGRGLVFIMQQMEYAFARVYYRFHLKDLSVTIMPGAGSCFKRTILLSVYNRHSGMRNGEDREATTLGMKMGYKAIYQHDIRALTRPPLTFRRLIIQRRRWYLGYLETVMKEQAYYRREMFRLSKIGLRTLQDITGIVLLLIAPIWITVLLLAAPVIGPWLLGGAYVLAMIYYAVLLLSSPMERKEVNRAWVGLIPVYPMFWMVVTCITWWKVLFRYHKNRRKYACRITEWRLDQN